MISLENIKTKIISKVKASNDQAFLEAIDRLFGSEKKQEIVDLTKALDNSKENAIKELKDAVQEMKQVKSGKLNARPLKELLDEL